MVRTILFILVSVLIGWIIGSQTAKQNQLDSSLAAEVCPQFASQAEDFPNDDLTLPEPGNTFTECPSVNSPVTANRDTDVLISKLLKNRSILPEDLFTLDHWNLLEEFIDYITELDLSTSDIHRLRAKAFVYFDRNYPLALEELYSAKQSAINQHVTNIIQGEINALTNYVIRDFFSIAPTVSAKSFMETMNLVHEKQPNYIPVISALVKHHLLTGDLSLAETYVNNIPPNEENQIAIDILKGRLDAAINNAEPTKPGIPLQKHGNHYMVKATINGDITLSLLLDTGASATAVSYQTMRAMLRASSQIRNLNISRYINTANGRNRVHLFQAKELDVGGFTLTNPLIIPTNLGEDNQIHGLLGMDFLGQFQFRIDHENSLLYLIN
ncbi:retropepsin-like aspartic protease family protein [Aliikangiella coralliicola]|uniref:Peptidase A2 domain-containing protein n=1 Tax=Aliikangiella coralliicola TaxID=2592383 RepID=A0A545UCW2_9GAMM|nr:retropepsin-like aspartic protease [Aliikangiella coralliicola]TQV87305.1 hypothetical protein FLL46_12715 [Aliikangiella coralliicola]